MKKTLKAGSVVNVFGIPVKLVADVEVSTSDENWRLIEQEIEGAHGQQGAKNVR